MICMSLLQFGVLSTNAIRRMNRGGKEKGEGKGEQIYLYSHGVWWQSHVPIYSYCDLSFAAKFFNRGDFTGVRTFDPFILFILLKLRRALSYSGKLIIAQLNSGLEIPSSAIVDTKYARTHTHTHTHNERLCSGFRTGKIYM